jgi:hypothetical protein
VLTDAEQELRNVSEPLIALFANDYRRPRLPCPGRRGRLSGVIGRNGLRPGLWQRTEVQLAAGSLQAVGGTDGRWQRQREAISVRRQG